MTNDFAIGYTRGIIQKLGGQIKKEIVAAGVVGAIGTLNTLEYVGLMRPLDNSDPVPFSPGNLIAMGLTFGAMGLSLFMAVRHKIKQNQAKDELDRLQRA